MKTAIEVSLYPLNEDYIPVIDWFIARLDGVPGIERKTNATALTEAGHDTTCTPVIFESPYRSDQRVSIRRKSKRPINDLFDSGMFKRRKMPKSNFQGWRDSVDIFSQEFMTKFPRRLFGRPRYTGFFISPH